MSTRVLTAEADALDLLVQQTVRQAELGEIGARPLANQGFVSAHWKYVEKV